jgi:hypothetical protein
MHSRDTENAPSGMHSIVEKNSPCNALLIEYSPWNARTPWEVGSGGEESFNSVIIPLNKMRG